MKTKELILKTGINLENIVIEPDTATSISYGFDANPDEFIDFAKKDVESDDKRGFVNALSNSKRAIDCQINKILCGIGVRAKKESLPKKLIILKDLGIVAPRIINKLIKKRNNLEHRYYCPERDEAEDAVDIALLFIEASNRKLNEFMDAFLIGNKGNMHYEDQTFKTCIYITFEYKNKEFELTGYSDGAIIGETKVSSANKDYLDLLKLAISAEFQKTITISGKEFFN